MLIMNKSEFARLMGVHKSQTTRWAAAGMPTLPSGDVDSNAAAAWVKRTIDPTQRVAQTRFRRRSATATHGAQPPGTDHLTVPDAAIVTALPLLAERMPAAAAVLARACGAGQDVARRLYAAMQIAAAQEVAAVLARLEVPPPGTGEWDGAALCVDWAGVDWKRLAGQAAVPTGAA
jgi:hypothetical protein